MPVLINFKICDNAKECGGIDVCPTGALYWDENGPKIAIDNDKCIGCGACESACPVGAIRFAVDANAYTQIEEEIRKDTRSEAVLFTDRYGATPIKEEYLKEMADVSGYLSEQKGIVVMELFKGDEVACLLESIPIKDLLKGLRALSYIKVDCDDFFCKIYNVQQTPALVVFKDGTLVGSIQGAYGALQAKELRQKLQSLINR